MFAFIMCMFFLGAGLGGVGVLLVVAPAQYERGWCDRTIEYERDAAERRRCGLRVLR